MSHKPNNILQAKENALTKPVIGISSSGAANAMQQKQLLTKKVRIVVRDIQYYNNFIFNILLQIQQANN